MTDLVTFLTDRNVTGAEAPVTSNDRLHVGSKDVFEPDEFYASEARGAAK